MKKSHSKKNWIIALILILSVSALYVAYPKSVKTSSSSQFLVDNKQSVNEQYWINGYDPNKEQPESVKIYFKDKNDWDTLQEKQTYLITYVTENNETWFVEFVK